VGSGGSLSPRGDWRAPSDSEAEVWLTELRENVPSGEARKPKPKPVKLPTARRGSLRKV